MWVCGEREKKTVETRRDAVAAQMSGSSRGTTGWLHTYLHAFIEGLSSITDVDCGCSPMSVGCETHTCMYIHTSTNRENRDFLFVPLYRYVDFHLTTPLVAGSVKSSGLLLWLASQCF